MRERFVRLGIDYGTSFSKLVFRDYEAPGGEKAYVMLRNGDFRIPSAVGIENTEFIFGQDPKKRSGNGSIVWHESIKMRVAGEVKQDYARHYYGPLRQLPEGFSAKDLAILTVWFLISEGKRAVREHLKTFTGSVSVGFSLGMPMSFYDDPELKTTFLEVARTAWELSKGLRLTERVSFNEARRILEFGQEAVKENGDVPPEDIRDWVRTEAEAALWWPFQSPSISPGAYAQIDIGAGTTNLSIFRIVPKHTDSGWIKASLAFFGAISPPIGMDAIDHALAKWKEGSTENSLAMRGREREILQSKMSDEVVAGVTKHLREAYRKTIEKAFATHLQSLGEQKHWERHKVFFLGGGSQLEFIVKQLRMSPLPWNQKAVHDMVLLEKPADILMADKSNVPQFMLPHVAVAYGLSNYAAEIPKTESPSEAPPMKRVEYSSKRHRLFDVDEWRFG